MNTDFLQEQASLYVSGRLPTERKEPFELLLQCDQELRHLTAELADVAAAIVHPQKFVPPAPELKSRVLQAIQDRPQDPAEALVKSDPQARVQWVSPAFSEMCGYPLEELQGKKLGPLLQGEKTDPETIGRLRQAIQSAQSCREIVLNYHKDGRAYWVEIVLTPIRDDDDRTICFIAQEYERTDIALP